MNQLHIDVQFGRLNGFKETKMCKHILQNVKTNECSLNRQVTEKYQNQTTQPII